MTSETIGADTSNSRGTAVLTSGTNGVKGSWTQLVASTARESYWLGLNLMGDPPSDISLLIDIGTGGAGAETAVIADLTAYINLGHRNIQFLIPLTIASGTRVSARCSQALNGVSGLYVSAQLYDDNSYGTVASTITLGLGSNQGTDVDTGGSANTKSSWVELDASTSADIDWIAVSMSHSIHTTHIKSNFLYDIATGAASSEVVLIPDIYFSASAQETPSAVYVFKETIPSGTRVAVRGQSDITDASDRIKDLLIIGGNGTPPAGGGGGGGVRNPFGGVL